MFTLMKIGNRYGFKMATSHPQDQSSSSTQKELRDFLNSQRNTFLYRNPSVFAPHQGTFPKYKTKVLRTFASLPVAAPGDLNNAIVEIVNAHVQPDLASYDSVLWRQDAKELLQYEAARFKGAEVNIMVKNPWYQKRMSSAAADGSERTDTVAFDWELLEHMDVHIARDDIVPSGAAQSDWILQNGVKHLRVGQNAKNPTHFAKGSKFGEQWHPRHVFFTDGELAANIPPSRSPNNFAIRQQGMIDQEAAVNYPDGYTVGVTGWPLINPNQEEDWKIVTECGFTINIYVRWYLELKSFNQNTP